MAGREEEPPRRPEYDIPEDQWRMLVDRVEDRPPELKMRTRPERMAVPTAFINPKGAAVPNWEEMKAEGIEKELIAFLRHLYEQEGLGPEEFGRLDQSTRRHADIKYVRRVAEVPYATSWIAYHIESYSKLNLAALYLKRRLRDDEV